MPVKKVQATKKRAKNCKSSKSITATVKTVINRMSETKELIHNDITCNEPGWLLENCQWENIHGLTLSCGQGNTHNERIGDEIEIKSLKYMIAVYFPKVSTINFNEPMRAVRVLVVQAKRNGTLTELLTVLNSLTGPAAINIAGDPTLHPQFASDFTLLKDILFTQPQVIAGNASNENAMLQSYKLRKFSVKPQAKRIVYTDGNTIPDLKGNIFVVAYKHLITVEPTVDTIDTRVAVCSMVRYKDL